MQTIHLRSRAFYRSLVLVLGALGGPAACDYKHDPNYCPGNPHDNCLNDGGAKQCTSSAECAPEVCDVNGSMTCVQCTPAEPAACEGATPVCGDDRACRACGAHSECADSDACLPDGSCAAAAQVAYVAPAPTGSDNTSCTKAMPCTSITKALATSRPYVKLTGTTNEQVTVDDQNVTFLAAPGAKLTDTVNGTLLRVDGTSQVAIYDLELTGASGAGTGYGIVIPAGSSANLSLTRVKVTNNVAGGVSAAAGTLTVARSTFSSNTGGGISINNAVFAIVGNVFWANGTQTGSVGGVSVVSSQNADNRIEFNSLNQNASQAGIGAGIHCIAGTFTARNNILSENGTLTNMEQVSGTCSHTHSIVRPGMLPPGTGNSSSDPMFANTATGDLHLGPGSPARGAADPQSSLTGIAELDIDGDARTQPADLGADEAP